MPIMGCYPDRRAIENELGGKWEKVETIDVDGDDVFIYDVDVDGRPLNINGFIIKLNLNKVITTITINDGVRDIFYNSNVEQFSFFKNKNNNGFNDFINVSSATESTRLRRTINSSVDGQLAAFNGNYLSIAITSQNEDVKGTIDVYFLRGV